MRVFLRTNIVELDNIAALAAAFDWAFTRDLLEKFIVRYRDYEKQLAVA